MTSSPAGARWIQHPLLLHALGGPTPVEFYLRFVVFDPVVAKLLPVSGATVRVVDKLGAVLKAAQPPAAGLTDLQGTTDVKGEVAFKGMISLVTGGGPELHFEVDGLSAMDWYIDGTKPIKFPVSKWSTAGWKSIDGTASGTLKNFSGKKLGDAAAPVEFAVGVPCWLKFGYERYPGESPQARFPSGTRIKIVTGTSTQVDLHDFRTNSSSELKTVLFTNVAPGIELRMLIYTRFVKARDDPNDLVLNRFAISIGDQTDEDEATESDVLPMPADKPFLRYDTISTPDPADPSGLASPAGYAFHFTGPGKKLKDVDPWVTPLESFSLCKRNALGAVEAVPAVLKMPSEFGNDVSFGSLAKKLRWQMTICSALHSVTLIREFHGLLSALLVGHSPPWDGLNLNSDAFETTFAITETQGPHTTPIPYPKGLTDLDPLRGRVSVPLTRLFETTAFEVPAGSRVPDRVMNFKNIVFHELGHCVMFRYSFDFPTDNSSVSDHLLTRFVDISQLDWPKVAFWEGWAVYYSMLLLKLEDFLKSQLERVDALDSTPGVVDLSKVVGETQAVLETAVENIFPTGIINAFQVRDGVKDPDKSKSNQGLLLGDVLGHPSLTIAGSNKGHASEMCLAFSLYAMTAFLVRRAGGTMSAPGPADGTGRLSQAGAEWYNRPAVRNILWKAVFAPFWSLHGVGEDTVEKFTTAIRLAMVGDDDWHKILRIFNTYYLLIGPPTITSITSAVQSGPNPQTVTVKGTGFVDIPASTDDGGMTATLMAPSSAAQSVAIAVAKVSELNLTASFPVTGDYTLRLIGRWGEYSYTISVPT
ncbi:MAG TPA: hypothetical protein VF603_02010 [Allosphingosinicella sp.]|jgi:hypothetical protein